MNEWLALFLGSVALYFGAEALVKSGAGLALRLGLTPLVIGLTVIAFGTSSPELVVSLDAALIGNGAISIGNVIGSNICNIALILGLCALIAPLKAEGQIVRREVPIMIGVALLAVLVVADGHIARWEGGLLLSSLFIYTWLTVKAARVAVAAGVQTSLVDEVAEIVPMPLWRSIVGVIIGLGVLVVGSHFFVKGAVSLAEQWGMSQIAIGLTIVAVGTSLPELATSLLAAIRGQGDVAIGNIVGSNIFNVLGILGAAALIKPVSSPGLAWVDLGVFLAVSVALLPVVCSGGTVSRVEGAVLLIAYAGYTYWLLVQSPMGRLI
jgi:cation:H+ antiporter